MAHSPLDEAGLERLALHYVGRYSTTRFKLASYLIRKARERGWSGSVAADAAAAVLSERLAASGYVDDQAFAAGRIAALHRRGYGDRRIGQALHAAGVPADAAAGLRNDAFAANWDAALRFAGKRRIGPFAPVPPDRAAKARAFAAMMRAGHSIDHAHRIVDAPPGQVPESDGR